MQRASIRSTRAALFVGAVCLVFVFVSIATVRAQSTQPATTKPDTQPAAVEKPQADGQAKGQANEPPERAEKADNDALKKKIEKSVHFWTNSISYRSYLHFNDNGKVRSEQHQLNLSIQARCPQDIGITGYRVLGIDKIVTSAGEKLELDGHRNHFGNNMRRIHRHGNGPMNFSIGLNLPLPTQRALRLEEVRGQVRFAIARGPKRKAVLDPLSKYLGKRIHINDFEGSRLRVTQDEGQIRLTMNSGLMDQYDEAKFFDADGRVLDMRGWGSGSSGNTRHRSYRVTVPKQGRVVIYYHDDTRKVDVPFAIEDVRLPKPPEAEPAIHLSIDAEPVGQVGANDDGAKPLQILIEQ